MSLCNRSCCWLHTHNAHCRDKLKEKQREELWKKLNQLEERHKASMTKKPRWRCAVPVQLSRLFFVQ